MNRVISKIVNRRVVKMRKFVIIVIMLLCVVFQGCQRTWNTPAMPDWGKLIFVFQLQEEHYKNYIIVNNEDSALVVETNESGKFLKYLDNAYFGYHDMMRDNCEYRCMCELQDSSFLYKLHGGYYMIYPCCISDALPNKHMVTNIPWGDVCLFSKDTMQLVASPYKTPQYAITERMVREYYNKTKYGDKVLYGEVVDYINEMIDSECFPQNYPILYVYEDGLYEGNPYFE